MRHRLLALGIFLVSLTVYIFTLSPHLSFTDAGELAGACASLGVAHPTGYPLFVILGFLWTHLPIPFTVIYKLNLFAATCTALSSAMMFLLCREVLQFCATQHVTMAAESTSKRHKKTSATVQSSSFVSIPPSMVSVDIISAAMALSYAFAQTVWAQATSIEVYSLHLAMLTSTMLAIVRAVIVKTSRAQLIAAVLLGLSFTNHLTTILVIVPISVLFFYRPGEKLNLGSERRRAFFAMLGIVMSCALVYLVLPTSSHNEPWFNWGAVHRGWEQFSYHVFGKQYSVWMFSGEKGVVAKQLGVFLRLLPYNLAFVGIPLSGWGLVRLFRSSHTKSFAIFFSLMIICGVSYSVNYNIHDIDSYFLSSYIALIILAGVGLYDVLKLAPKLALTALVIPFAALTINWKHCDQHDNVLVREYVHMMVDPLPHNAVLFSQQWDYFCSGFWYMQQVEGYRPDVTLIEKELIRRTWFPAQLERWYPAVVSSSRPVIDDFMINLRDFEHDPASFTSDPRKPVAIQAKFIQVLNSLVDKNIDTRPIFATQEVFQGEEGFAKDYVKTPFGLALRVSRTQPTEIADTNLLAIESFSHSASKHHTEHLEADIAQMASRELENNANYLLNTQRAQQAEWFARAALIVDPNNNRATDDLHRIKDSKP